MLLAYNAILSVPVHNHIIAILLLRRLMFLRNLLVIYLQRLLFFPSPKRLSRVDLGPRAIPLDLMLRLGSRCRSEMLVYLLLRWGCYD